MWHSRKNRGVTVTYLMSLFHWQWASYAEHHGPGTGPLKSFMLLDTLLFITKNICWIEHAVLKKKCVTCFHFYAFALKLKLVGASQCVNTCASQNSDCEKGLITGILVNLLMKEQCVFFTADILTCHITKSTVVNNNINNFLCLPQSPLVILTCNKEEDLYFKLTMRKKYTLCLGYTLLVLFLNVNALCAFAY